MNQAPDGSAGLLDSRGARLIGRPLATRADLVGAVRAAADAARAEPGSGGLAVAKLGSAMRIVWYYLWLRKREPTAQELELVHFAGILQGGLFPWDVPSLREYMARYNDALASIDYVGMFLDETPSEIAAARAVPGAVMYYTDQEPDRSIPARPELCYLPALEGLRVLIVSPFAELLARRANAETFEAVWRKTGKRWFNPASVDALEFPYGFEPATQQKYGSPNRLLDEILGRIDERAFDVALIGAAGYAIPIAAHIRQKGRIAIDLGGHIQVLFGVLGNRWRSSPEWMEAYVNEAWIDMPAQYQPTVADVCDRHAYW